MWFLTTFKQRCRTKINQKRMRLKLKPFDKKSNWRIIKLLLNPKTKKDLGLSIPGYIFTKFRNPKNYSFEILANKEFVGSVNIIESEDIKGYEIGYFVIKKFRNKGIASESIKKLLNFASKELKLKKVYAITGVDNPASTKVLEKNKFKKTKTHNKYKEATWEKKLK